MNPKPAISTVLRMTLYGITIAHSSYLRLASLLHLPASDEVQHLAVC